MVIADYSYGHYLTITVLDDHNCGGCNYDHVATVMVTAYTA